MFLPPEVGYDDPGQVRRDGHSMPDIGLLDMGCKKENLRAWIAGGANVIPSLVSPVGDIGAMNVRAVREALRKEGIRVAGEHLGGNYSRTMRLYISSGKVTVSTDEVAAEI